MIYTAYDVSLRGLNFPITEWLVPVVTHASEHDVEGILEEVRIYEDLAPVGDDLLILKHCYSGFYGTELDLVLRSLNVSTVVICGTMTNYCCGATAREALDTGTRSFSAPTSTRPTIGSAGGGAADASPGLARMIPPTRSRRQFTRRRLPRNWSPPNA